jgi:hypothetical protein
MKYVLASMLLASGLAHGLTCTNLPVGATALGYTTQLFYDQPALTEVSTTDTDSTSKWYPGSFSAPVSVNLASRELLSTQGGILAVGLGAGIDSETHSSKAGGLPLLNGAQGFYVEFAMRLTNNNSDHFTGLFLQTQEHDLAKHDHLSTDPAGFERWTEIDVSEAGYGTGSLATVINWTGTYPHYTSQTLNSYGHDAALDWTVEHRYGVSWNPATNTLQWYIDDVPTWKEVMTNSVIKDFHYYLVMEAGSHGSHVPYDMLVRYVTAYTK